MCNFYKGGNMKKKFGMIFLSTLLVIVSAFFTGCFQGNTEVKLTFIVDDAIYETLTLSDDAEINMPEDPVKEGMIFDGWYWDEGTWQDELYESQLFSGEITISGEVYAKWILDPNAPDDPTPEDPTPENPTPDDPEPEDPDEDAVYYTITLNLNGGTMDGETTIQLEYGKPFTLPIPSKGSYQTFCGWCSDPYATVYVTNPQGESLSEYNYESDMTFYARFSQYTYILYPNNVHFGTCSPETTDSGIAAVAGTSITVTAIPKTGYRFIGWYNDDILVSEDAEYTFEMPYCIYELEARFEAIKPKVTVKADTSYYDYANAGTVNTIDNQEYAYNSELTLKATTKKGYTFLGWYKDDELISTNATHKIRVIEDATYLAKWTKIQFTLKYPQLNRGTTTIQVNTDEPVTSSWHIGYIGYREGVTKGSTITLSTTPSDREDYSGKRYTWLGYLASDGTTLTTEYTYTFTFEEETTITPTWQECAVKVSGTDEIGGTVNIPDNTRYGHSTTITATTNVGYIWHGWYLNDELVTEDKVFEEIIYTTPKNYVAKWELCTDHEFVNCYCECNAESHESVNTMYCIHEDKGIVCFGMYPQSQVTDEALITALNGTLVEKAPELDYRDGKYYGEEWTQYSYLAYYEYKSALAYANTFYVDKTYEGETYRGVHLLAYRPSNAVASTTADHSYQDDNGYALNTTYWFKYEPIKWNIIGEENGKYLLMSDLIIDGQQYQRAYVNDNGNYYNSTYTYSYKYESDYYEDGILMTTWHVSSIRDWLNGTFYNTAFDDSSEKKMIATRWSTNQSDYYRKPFSEKISRIEESTEDYTYTQNDELLRIETEYGNSNEGIYPNQTYISICDDIFLANAETLKQLQLEDFDLAKTSTDYAKMQGLGEDKYFMRTNYFDPETSDKYLRNDGHYIGMPFIGEDGEFLYGNWTFDQYCNISGVVPMMIFDSTIIAN